MQIVVMGTGYVGLVAGSCLAELGNDVTCIDIDQDKVDALNRGEVPIYEPGLDAIILRNARAERLIFKVEAKSALSEAEIVFIAVGTPSTPDGTADLQYVYKVAEEVGDTVRRPGVLVVCKSTVPIGTNHRVREIMKERAIVPFHVVSNPEFLREGAAVEDFLKPNRIVIGADNKDAAELMEELYSPLVRTGAPILHMDVTSAEMTKYAANCMLATRISFMNEIANLCGRGGADVAQVRRGLGSDPRIGKHYLFPGVGYGGSCFPKDVRALARTGRAFDYPMAIVEAVQEVNEAQKRVLVGQVKQHFGAGLKGLKMAVWGLAFKARTDDMREAPSIVVIEELLEAGAEVAAFDPEAMEVAKGTFGDRITYGASAYDVLSGASGLLVVTDWNSFRTPNFERVLGLMKDDPVIFDGRNLYEPERIRSRGFTYYAIGRATTSSGSRRTESS